MRTTHRTPFRLATVRTYGKTPLLSADASKQMLLNQFLETRRRFKLDVAGYVILDDHAHFLFRLDATHDPAAALNDLRAGFTRTWRQKTGENAPIWERGHEIRPAHSADELRSFLDFIHYDPVRHHLAEKPADYPWSSLPTRIAQGHYSNYWGVLEPPASLAQVVQSGSLD